MRPSATCASCWSRSTRCRSPPHTWSKSRRWPRGRAPWRGSSSLEFRATVPASAPRRVAAVVVVAPAAPRTAQRRPDERRATGDGAHGATVDRAPPDVAALAVPRRLDHRRRGAAPGLGRAPRKCKVVALLTGGENNKGMVDPRPAAQAAATFGIKIYTIGVGTQGEAPVPTGQGPLGLRYETMPVKIDGQLLSEVAHTTGGRYFRATDAASLSNIFGEINRLEKTPVQQ